MLCAPGCVCVCVREDDATQRNNGERTGDMRNTEERHRTKREETFGPERMFARSNYAASAEERLHRERHFGVRSTQLLILSRRVCHLAHLLDDGAFFSDQRAKLNNRFAFFVCLPVSATANLCARVLQIIAGLCEPSRSKSDRIAVRADRSAHNVRA